MSEFEGLKLWEKVEKTDPAHTKPVSFGSRKFTAIDPYWQIRAATEQFGPAGIGWGWTVQRVDYLPTNHVAVLVRLWITTLNAGPAIEQWGQTSLFMDKNEKMKDSDCMKKATTDAITKCLSYMGFNADVFLGKFDDNKYVQENTAQFEAKKAVEASKPIEPTEEEKEWLAGILVELGEAESMDDIKGVYIATKDSYQVMDARNPIRAQYEAAFKSAKEKVGG
jgi:hypothetical protein